MVLDEKENITINSESLKVTPDFFEMNNYAKEVLDIEANAILKMEESLGLAFKCAIDVLSMNSGRVIVTGMGKSGHIGRKIAATLSSTGTPAYFLHPAESTHGDCGLITKDDVVLAISYSGETEELLNLLPYVKRLGVPLISMTGNDNSSLAYASDIVLSIFVEKEACPLNKAPTASTTVTLALGDALAMCLLKKRGFTESDFLVFHPSGALGKNKTYRVKQLMLTENLPFVHLGDNFLDVVNIVSKHKLGLALVIDEKSSLKGILTDGDIRRTLTKFTSFDKLKIDEVMTAKPKTVKDDDFATSALRFMEKFSITALPVISKSGKVVGIIHIHDLLRAGVV